MKLVNYNGTEFSLSEKSWRQMLRRFDSNKADLNIFGYYCIRVKHICALHKKKCSHCPLAVISRRPNACTDLFDYIMGEDFSSFLYIFDHAVLWHSKYDIKARQAIQKVREVLLTAGS